ncbi:Uncharacterised protein [Enterobacter cloacae]|uniref:hypothetical protein n=1 Tax=Enterobacter cloacae TaxID=550 RepID=UPI000793DB79|nr:hypothetical protein [Enterobacter cloacae]SAE93608.1 Uncharacterised protein [Enterobacter cloacae]
MSISDTLKAQRYASVAEVAAAQAKLYADKLESAPDYAEQAAASALAAAASAQVAVSAESVVNDLAISASESATSAAASAAEAGNAAAAAVGQCIRVPTGESVSPLPAAADRINTFLVFTDDGSVSLMPESDVAILDSEGKIPVSMIPAVAISQAFVVSSQSAMLALSAQVGDVAKRTDLGYSFILSAEPASTLSNWVQLTDDVLAQLGLPTGATQVGATDDTGANTTVQGALDLKVSIASLSANTTAAKIGTAGGISIQAWMANDFKSKFGGVADYTGTPLYDGNDATRITATDNSPMLQNALNNGLVKNGVLHIYFPAGHYGFKSDGVAKVADSNVHTVIFHGAGSDNTILDFIFERSDTIGTNVQPSNASMIARLTGFKRVVWKDLHCKCTTKSGTIDGSTDPSADNPSVYYGAVWFSHAQDCENVRYENVKMQRGNYRGFSVDAQNLAIGYRTKVSMVNCEGFENTSTGYWLSFCNSLYVQGGQFYHNGTKGFLATGYGIAASQYVDDILIVGGATFYENYRKGFDRHGGVGSMVISGCVFADNLLRDIEDNKQYNAQYPAEKLNYNHYSSCQFLINRNPTWLSEALAAVNNNSSCLKAYISILDRLIAGTIAGKQKEISVSNCSFKVIGNAPDGYVGFNGFSLEAPLTTFDNCVIDTTGFRLASTVSGNVYSSFMFGSVHDNAIIRFRNTSVKTHPGAIIHPSSGEISNSVLFTVQPTTVIEADSASSFDLNNFIFSGVSGSGNVSQFLGQRKLNGCEFKFRDAKLRTQNQTVTNAFSWINNGFGLKGSSGNNFINACSIGFGDCKNMSPINGVGTCGAIQRFTIPAQSKTSGSTGKILSGKVDSNLQIELKGGMELVAETFKVTWRYSAWTKNLVSASPTINIDRAATLEAITYNGAATNFLAQPLTISWTANTGDTAWYDGAASAADGFLPLIISVQ